MSPVRLPSVPLAAVAVCAAAGLLPSAAHAAGTWSAPTQLSATGNSANYPTAVTFAGGAATAVWLESSSNTHWINVADRTPDGRWTVAQRLSEPSAQLQSSRDYAPQVAVEPSGAVNVAWLEKATDGGATFGRIQVSRRVPGGTWQTEAVTSGNAVDVASPTLAADDAGRVFVAWREGQWEDMFFLTRRRNPQGLWGPTDIVLDGRPEFEDGESWSHYSYSTPRAIRMTHCGGRPTAVFTSTGTSFDHGEGPGSVLNESGPQAVGVKAASPTGGWPGRRDGIEWSGVVSDTGVGSIACSTAGDLAVAGVGDTGYWVNGELYGSQIQYTSAVREAGSFWGGTIDHGAIPTVRQLAFGAGRTLFRVVELNQQVQIASRPLGGAWGPAVPVLPANSPTTNPFFYVDPTGTQTLIYGRSGDVAARAEVRQRSSDAAAWSEPVTISGSGGNLGATTASGAADGSLTALVLHRPGSSYRLMASSFKPTPPAPARVPVKLSGATLTFDLDLAVKAGASCPAAGAIWVTPTNTVNGVKTNVPIKSRALSIAQSGSGPVCVVRGTVTLSRTPSRTGLTVSIGGTGLTARTVVPA